MMLRFLATALLAAAALAQVTPQRLQQQAQAYFDLGRFNGAVLVAKDGKPLLSQGFGMANSEWNIPATPETRFRLGSITKQFTAMAVLLLEQDGRLKTSDPVCRFVEPCPAAWQPLTLHHLPTHTSGVPNFTSFDDYEKTMTLASPPLATLARLCDRPLDFAPGSSMKYSNSGYLLLGAVIEKASGQSYEEFLRARVFWPLEMRDTGYDHPSDVLARRAAGYETKGGRLTNAAYLDMTIPHAAGALYSTTGDLLKSGEAYRNPAAPRSAAPICRRIRAWAGLHPQHPARRRPTHHASHRPGRHPHLRQLRNRLFPEADGGRNQLRERRLRPRHLSHAESEWAPYESYSPMIFTSARFLRRPSNSP